MTPIEDYYKMKDKGYSEMNIGIQRCLTRYEPTCDINYNLSEHISNLMEFD